MAEGSGGIGRAEGHLRRRQRTRPAVGFTTDRRHGCRSGGVPGNTRHLDEAGRYPADRQEHHRTMPRDSGHVQAAAVLARAQQDAVWERQQHTSQISPCCASTAPLHSGPSPTALSWHPPSPGHCFVPLRPLRKMPGPGWRISAGSCSKQDGPHPVGRNRQVPPVLRSTDPGQPPAVEAPSAPTPGACRAAGGRLSRPGPLAGTVEKTLHAHPGAPVLVKDEDMLAAGPGMVSAPGHK